MTQKILHPKEIETSTVRLSCGNKCGTAFFIRSEDGSQILLTSEHNIVDEQPIKLTINETEIEAEVLERIPEKDVALLIIKNNLIQGINTLPLKCTEIPYNESWECYGFPKIRVTARGRYSGSVSRTNNDTKWDIDLECEQYNNLKEFNGLSGAALVANGFVIGVIGYDNTGTLGATSILSIIETLNKHSISVEKEIKHSIPDSIEKDISTTTTNEEVLQRINDVINEQITNSYFLITGNPGSGKTTIAAQLKFEDANHIVCDRFFVKVPEKEVIPTQIRATPEFFMKWLEEVYHRILYNAPPPKSEKSLNERVLEIRQGIQQLSAHYQRQSKIAFLIIDGLDDVEKSTIENYISLLPDSLPPNLKVIFSCTSKAVLPNRLKAIISSNTEIKVTPLPVQTAKKYLTENLERKNLTSTQISDLALKSEGHPLYLRYLTQYISEIDETSIIDDWIHSIPVISGEIERYYNKIWLELEHQVDETWLAATLSRLRIPVDKNILPKMLPEETKHSFVSSFKKIQHLLRNEEKVSIYHTSFSDFTNEKMRSLNEQIHANIAQYTHDNPVDDFSISEKIYHLSNGNGQNRKQALTECNQIWIDDCAINSVNPDIVLADVKNVIALAAELGIAHKVISLLLLSQRINFRYNTLFDENVVFLVNALLTLKKPKEAIRYVERNKTLIVPDEDALYLLQRFYEYGADEEAEILLDAIKRTCSDILEYELTSDSFKRFVNLKFSAVTLSANSDFEDAFHEFGHIKSTAIKMIQTSGNPKEVIHKFLDDVGSYNAGYFIWRFDIPPSTKLVEKELDFEFNEKSSGFIALNIHRALDFQVKSPKTKKEDNIPAWIEDLEYVIDKYGVHTDYYFVLLYVLIERSERIDLIKKIFDKFYIEKEEFDFRDENGVDLNHTEILRYGLYAECLGFLDTVDGFPEFSGYRYSYNDWEENIKELFTYLCFFSGKAKRYTIDKKDVNVLKPRLVELIKNMIPGLEHRMHWERSYALPELMFQIIYKRLIQILIDNFPDYIPVFIDEIVGETNYQLGLYTEGYIDSLFVIARKLSKETDQNVSAFKVTKVLEKHVLNTVENRWDRNEYLLRLVEIYAILDNEDKANDVFKEMIATSMGPSWYKEAQLGIINTAVSNIFPKNGDLSYLQKFAAQLHCASGEMTFQRYIRQQQEEFAGDLAKIGFLDKSIAYFKYLLLPDNATVITNAESSVVDAPHESRGYILGARAIEEQAGVSSLLQNIDCKGSLVAWGLSELFILGDDRYNISDYTKIQANILNYIESNESDKLDALLKRFSRFVITEINDEFRHEYIRKLFDKLSDSNFEKAQSYLQVVGMHPAQQQEENENEKYPNDAIESEDPLDKLVTAKQEAQEKLSVENKTGARKIIVQALENVQDEKYGIWSSMYSSKINDIRNLLSETYTNTADFIKDLKKLIVNEPYFEEWIIANEIVKQLRNIDDEEEKQLILAAILEHIELMVRTPSYIDSKYEWISSQLDESGCASQEEQLLGLLIWFLNHPSLAVKNRTIEILVWLGTIAPKFIVDALMQEIVSEGYKISKELSASIIHQLSNLNPENYANALLQALEQNEGDLVNLNHFMIRDSIIAALKELKKHGIDVNDWVLKFEQTFKPISTSKGEVIIEKDYTVAIDDYIYELNELKILTRQFAETLLGQIEKLVPLSIEDSQKASKYIDRSFNDYNDINLISDFYTLLRYALNVAVTCCVTLNDSEKVANILRFYQPTFPENRLTPHISTGEEFENTVKEIFEKNEIDFAKLLINNEIPLNYYSRKHKESRSHPYDRIELNSYLIPATKHSSKGYSYSWLTFPANSFPDASQIRDYEEVIPLFIRSEMSSNITGSDLVPSILNTYSAKLPEALESSIKSNYWRRGRNWNQRRRGIADRTGYYTTISKEQIRTIKSEYKLILQIYYNHKSIYIDFFEQKEIKLR